MSLLHSVLPDSLNIPVSLELGASGDDLAVISANELPANKDLAVLGGRSALQPGRGAVVILKMIDGLITLIVVGDRVLLNSRGLLLLNEVYIEIHVVVHRSLVARPGIRCFVVAKLQTTLSVEVVNLVARLRRHVTLERLSYLFLALLNRNPQ